MPSKEYREKQLVKALAEMDPKVKLSLRPFGVVYFVLASQLAVLSYFAVSDLTVCGKSHANIDQAHVLSLTDGSCIHLDGFHPVIFNILVQWLADGKIWPTRDCSVPPTTSIVLDFLDVTFAQLFDTNNDVNPFSMTTARKLVQAYFMGQRLGAQHFMDAIMNLTIRHLRIDSPPLPHHVFQVYSRSNTGLHGFKKLLVDAWIWANRVSSGHIPRLTDYMPEFQQHVQATLEDMQTRKHTFDTANPNNPRNRETVDIDINFNALENCLCHGNQGLLKCRYHVHTTTEPCWNLIVDSTPVTAPPPRPIGSHRR